MQYQRFNYGKSMNKISLKIAHGSDKSLTLDVENTYLYENNVFQCYWTLHSVYYDLQTSATIFAPFREDFSINVGNYLLQEIYHMLMSPLRSDA